MPSGVEKGCKRAELVGWYVQVLQHRPRVDGHELHMMVSIVTVILLEHMRKALTLMLGERGGIRLFVVFLSRIKQN